MVNRKSKIYLDTNIYGRPFDDLSDPIIQAEAVASLTIFKLISKGEFDLLSSDILYLEITQTEPLKRFRMLPLLSLAKTRVKLDDKLIHLSQDFESISITGPDAIHLASAVLGGAEYFITEDKKILKLSQKINKVLENYNYNLEIINSLLFITKII